MNRTHVGNFFFLVALIGFTIATGVSQQSDAATIQFSQITSNGA